MNFLSDVPDAADDEGGIAEGSRNPRLAGVVAALAIALAGAGVAVAAFDPARPFLTL